MVLQVLVHDPFAEPHRGLGRARRRHASHCQDALKTTTAMRGGMGAVAADVWEKVAAVAVAVGVEGVNATRERLRWTDSWGSCVERSECRELQDQPERVNWCQSGRARGGRQRKSLGGRRAWGGPHRRSR